jgi:hypothetical protein
MHGRSKYLSAPRTHRLFVLANAGMGIHHRIIDFSRGAPRTGSTRSG